jgi:tetratricopeptide (TPR) repeat protein
MARRRLNKKVALIGSTVFLLLVMAAVVVILRLNRDPAPFLADGDAAWAAQDYEAARENYARAYGLTDSSTGKIELLFKLADVHRQTDQWDKVLKCWGMIVTSDPQNVKARLGQLKYSYILADSLGNAGRSMSGFWDQVLTQARDTVKVIERAALLNDDETGWEPSFGAVGDRRWGSARQLGPRLRFIRGRAALELARMGAVTSPGELLKEAEADLQEARKLDPNNAQVYHYLAEVFLEKGEIAASRGNLDEKDTAEKQADDILAEGVRAADSTPDAHIHLLARKLAVAQRGGITAAREQMKTLEAQYEGLTQRFGSHPRAFAALAQFYSFYAAYLDSKGALGKLDQAIKAAEQARSLDDGNVEYVIFAAGYHYRKFSIHGDTSALQEAIELTETALKLPEAQDTPGPTQYARRINRFSLCSLLAKCCIERVLALPGSDPAREGYLAQAQKAVREIGQIQGSGENPEVLKWQGMLDLANGQTGKAVKNLYAAYEKIKADNPPEERDPFLSLTLANIFKDTSESGAARGSFRRSRTPSWIMATRCCGSAPTTSFSARSTRSRSDSGRTTGAECSASGLSSAMGT